MTETHEAMTDSYDIAIVGGGPAGSAAGVFLARADFEVLLFDHGQSTLQKCAFLENYLGFPAGISPTDFRELTREHTDAVGCNRLEAAVERISETSDGGFRIHSQEGTYVSRYVLATSWAETDYLSPLGVETIPEKHPGEVQVVTTDDDGETTVDGVYAAGRVTETYHQAIVNAGDGARVARSIIERERPEFYNDWVVPDGYYERYDRAVPAGVEEISHEERRERERRAAKKMAAFFNKHQ
ncbi:NAD(P)/FAD-dependent oxidoreductase [Halogeometricum borinquense]|uniref:NAD(P)/FAD-dependent oxidoreductase n=1 Tax=Halogeometricum borinquense TaxID=60847 RepID=A0A6C0UJ73_9EURY|nr:FAD-dependent oxidoreductase [Halogeometricum borinquense]QIB73899.1 NAD(P)/FAD-dependent oxidoreductase [Halogeometricum borinquense]